MPFASNPFLLLASLVVSAFLFTRILANHFGIKKNGWRNAELVFLGAGALSFFGLSNALRIDSAKARLPAEEAKARVMGRALVNFTEGSPDELVSSYCRPFVAGSEKPLVKLRNPDEEADRASVCRWLVGISQSKQRDPETFDPSTLPKPPPARTERTATLLSVYQPMLRAYEDQFEEVAALRERARRSDWEKWFGDFSPFLAAVALGLRVAKVFGEKRLDAEAAPRLGLTA